MAAKGDGTPISIRLDAETERELRRLTFATGATVSSVVREAVAQYAAAWHARAHAVERPYDRLRPHIGIVNRERGRSERTGERFRERLKAKSRARRSR